MEREIKLNHGSGGVLTHRLIKEIFLKIFNNKILRELEDSAEIGSLAFTTDSYVVKPLFFPGGDIGKLSICGTVNDLAMKGAIPKYISITYIIEEGFAIDDLHKICVSAQISARKAGVKIVAGDTKVVERGSADGIFITTSGIGVIPKGVSLSYHNVEPGDLILINGTIGDHGIAVLNKRLKLGLSMKLSSDCAALNSLVQKMLKVNKKSIRMLRDPTRGGVATTLNEISEKTNLGIIIDEASLPIKKEVAGACELLGLDPLYVANEGKLIAIVDSKYSERLIRVMKSDQLGKEAKIIGQVVKKPKGVYLRTLIGGLRPLLMLETEMLPRIC
ncbi:MAG: hydrogenase expression/formation protein HypE [candidate division WOR-3 bacterium]